MISIVIPAFNVAKYIKKCIDSILSQSYSDWELIIVDDHSNDDTVQIIKENYLGDDRINLIQRTKNSGGCRIPRFEGIKASTGKFICCIDADDFVEDTFLQKLIDREQQTGCSIILGKMVFCDQDDIIEDRTIPNKNFNMNIIEDGYNITQRTIGGWEIAMNGMLVKSDLYKDYINSNINKSDNYGYADEIDHRQILLKAEKVAMIDAEYYYRMNPNGITHNRSSIKSFDNLRSLLLLNNFVRSIYNDQKAITSRFEANFVSIFLNSYVSFIRERKNYTIQEREYINSLLKECELCIFNYKMRGDKYKIKIITFNRMILFLSKYAYLLKSKLVTQ